MRPWRLAVAIVVDAGQFGIFVELVVPDDVVIRAVVDLIEGGADRIVGRVADTGLAYPKRLGVTVGRDELLTELRLSVCLLAVVLNVSGERTVAHCIGGAARKGFGVEFENEPPIDRRLCVLDKWRRWSLRVTDCRISGQES